MHPGALAEALLWGLLAVNDILSLWIAELESDAPRAVAAILAGRTSRGALQQSDSDGFFVAALAHAGGERDHVAALLDQGLLDWLLARRKMTPASIGAHGASTLISQLDRALVTVARARLRNTAQNLVGDHLVWDEWLTPLRRRDWIDVVDSFDEALALNQEDARLLPRWFSRLADAGWGGSAWQSGLRIGLIGLRKMPHPAGTRPESRVAAGLVHFARHALTRGVIGESEIRHVFRREALVLLEIYPRRAEHWQEVWTASLQQIKFFSVGKVRLHEWLYAQLLPLGLMASFPDEMGTKATEPNSKTQRTRRATLAVTPTRKDELDALVLRFASGELSRELWKDTRTFVERNRRYADASGDGFYLVRTVSNLGSRLLRTSMPPDALMVLRDWILGAMSFAPNNAYLWDLWARLQQALGRHDDALAVLWETVRRFPEDPVVRNRLAGVLRDNSRTALAEGVLRETMHDFPGDTYSRTALAELLRESDRPDEAELLLRETIRDFPGDAVCRGTLAVLLKKSGRKSEAEEFLREAIDVFPGHLAFRNILAELLWESGSHEEAEKLLRSTMSDFPKDPFSRTTLAALLLQQGKVDEAEALMVAMTKAQAEHPIPCLLLARCKLQRAKQARNEVEEQRWLREALEKTKKALRRDSRHAGALELKSQIDAQLALLDSRNSEALEPKSQIDAQAAFNGGPRSGDATADGEELRSAPETIESLAPSEASLSEDEDLREESERFLHLNIIRGNEFAEWYSAAHDLNGNERPERSGANEFEVVAGCLRYENESVVILPPGKEILESQPGSYSLRILAAYGRSESTGRDAFSAEVAALGHEFPNMRTWSDWLRLPELDKERRVELMSGGRSKEGPSEKAFWSGRLLAVYPELGKSNAAGSAAADEQSKRAALERLVADVAIACAARSEPRVGSVISN